MNIIHKMKGLFNKNNKTEKIENSGNEFPRVVYENDNVKKEIDSWVKFMCCDSFSEILLDIGFYKDDVVYLYEGITNKLMFYYSVNNDCLDFDDSISLCYGSMVEGSPSISVRYGFETKKYEKGRNTFELKEHEIKVDDNVSYKRCYFDFSALFYVKINDYRLSLSVYRSFDNEDRYILNNEDRLFEYLTSLTLPTSIVDVYKKICEICSIDGSKCNEFKLSFSRLSGNDKNKEEVTDMICLYDGNFRKFGITKDGKRIVLNHDDSWSYKMIDDDSLVKFSMNVENGNISYNVSSSTDSEIDDYTETLAMYDISTARREIEDTKKLVRTMFNRK